MPETKSGVSERRRLGRILLGLDDQPPAIVRRRQGREHLVKIDAAVAWHSKDAVENGVEKAHIAGADEIEHVASHILAVHMRDAGSVPPGESAWIDAREDQMRRVEEEADAVTCRLYQAVDFDLAFDHCSHVMVVNEANAALQQALGNLGQPPAEIQPAAMSRGRAESGRRRSPAMPPLVSA